MFFLSSLSCCFAVYKVRLFVMEGSNPFVKSKHSCVFDRKHVPALLQTAVSFHTPYSVNEKSSLLLCPVTKFQDKFASLRHVNSSNSQDEFQICYANMYLVEFQANFTVFRMFLLISRDFADIPEFSGSVTM